MREPGRSYIKINSLWVLLFGIIVLFLPVVFIIFKVKGYTGGVFIYPFDDTFIHLKIADVLLTGNWGINEKEFASASSSVLYTLILAFSRLFSNSVLVPLVVNCLAGIAILVAVSNWLKKHQVHYVAQGLIILLAVFFTPLALLVVSGMEHTLQCLFSFLFIFYFSDWLEESASKNQRVPFRILLVAVLAATIRYEGLFLIAIACVLLLFYRKITAAFFLGFIAILPLIVFGLISLSKGNYFLPNSVLMKSESLSYSNPLQLAYNIFFERLVFARNGLAALATQRLVIIIPLLYLLFRKFLKPSYSFILIILFGAAVLQLAFASTGYLYRYEAYLFFCFIIITPLLFYKYGKSVLSEINSFLSRLIALGLSFFLLFPLVLRSSSALEKTPRACINIYEQQYQMATFTKSFYNQGAVALNDIGAVSYFTDAKIVDLWGLASIEVAKSRRDGYWNTSFLDSLCRAKKVKFVIVYDVWFSDSLTGQWTRVASWQIQDNVICGDDVVSFYCTDPLAKDILQQQLKTFEDRLPASVLVKYY